MDPLLLISEYYPLESHAWRILLEHSLEVTEKAEAIALAHPELQIDLPFLREAAMLHDIGIFLTDAPDLGCTGSFPYLCHGYLGADLLREKGLPRHALVCERHTGMGISREMIREGNLPLPDRDMLPVSPEEQLICFADKFFSKSRPGKEKNTSQIRCEALRFGEMSVERFDHWCQLFSTP